MKSNIVSLTNKKQSIELLNYRSLVEPSIGFDLSGAAPTQAESFVPASLGLPRLSVATRPDANLDSMEAAQGGPSNPPLPLVSTRFEGFMGASVLAPAFLELGAEAAFTVEPLFCDPDRYPTGKPKIDESLHDYHRLIDWSRYELKTLVDPIIEDYLSSLIAQMPADRRAAYQSDRQEEAAAQSELVELTQAKRKNESAQAWSIKDRSWFGRGGKALNARRAQSAVQAVAVTDDRISVAKNRLGFVQANLAAVDREFMSADGRYKSLMAALDLLTSGCPVAAMRQLSKLDSTEINPVLKSFDAQFREKHTQWFTKLKAQVQYLNKKSQAEHNAAAISYFQDVQVSLSARLSRQGQAEDWHSDMWHAQDYNRTLNQSVRNRETVEYIQRELTAAPPQIESSDRLYSIVARSREETSLLAGPVTGYAHTREKVELTYQTDQRVSSVPYASKSTALRMLAFTQAHAQHSASACNGIQSDETGYGAVLSSHLHRQFYLEETSHDRPYRNQLGLINLEDDAGFARLADAKTAGRDLLEGVNSGHSVGIDRKTGRLALYESGETAAHDKQVAPLSYGMNEALRSAASIQPPTAITEVFFEYVPPSDPSNCEAPRPDTDTDTAQNPDNTDQVEFPPLPAPQSAAAPAAPSAAGSIAAPIALPFRDAIATPIALPFRDAIATPIALPFGDPIATPMANPIALLPTPPVTREPEPVGVIAGAWPSHRRPGAAAAPVSGEIMPARSDFPAFPPLPSPPIVLPYALNGPVEPTTMESNLHVPARPDAVLSSYANMAQRHRDSSRERSDRLPMLSTAPAPSSDTVQRFRGFAHANLQRLPVVQERVIRPQIAVSLRHMDGNYEAYVSANATREHRNLDMDYSKRFESFNPTHISKFLNRRNGWLVADAGSFTPGRYFDPGRSVPDNLRLFDNLFHHLCDIVGVSKRQAASPGSRADARIFIDSAHKFGAAAAAFICAYIEDKRADFLDCELKDLAGTAYWMETMLRAEWGAQNPETGSTPGLDLVEHALEEFASLCVQIRPRDAESESFRFLIKAFGSSPSPECRNMTAYLNRAISNEPALLASFDIDSLCSVFLAVHRCRFLSDEEFNTKERALQIMVWYFADRSSLLEWFQAEHFIKLLAPLQERQQDKDCQSVLIKIAEQFNRRGLELGQTLQAVSGLIRPIQFLSPDSLPCRKLLRTILCHLEANLDGLLNTYALAGGGQPISTTDLRAFANVLSVVSYCVVPPDGSNSHRSRNRARAGSAQSGALQAQAIAGNMARFLVDHADIRWQFVQCRSPYLMTWIFKAIEQQPRTNAEMSELTAALLDDLREVQIFQLQRPYPVASVDRAGTGISRRTEAARSLPLIFAASQAARRFRESSPAISNAIPHITSLLMEALQQQRVTDLGDASDYLGVMFENLVIPGCVAAANALLQNVDEMPEFHRQTQKSLHKLMGSLLYGARAHRLPVELDESIRSLLGRLLPCIEVDPTRLKTIDRLNVLRATTLCGLGPQEVSAAFRNLAPRLIPGEIRTLGIAAAAELCATLNAMVGAANRPTTNQHSASRLAKDLMQKIMVDAAWFVAGGAYIFNSGNQSIISFCAQSAAIRQAYFDCGKYKQFAVAVRQQRDAIERAPDLQMLVLESAIRDIAHQDTQEFGTITNRERVEEAMKIVVPFLDQLSLEKIRKLSNAWRRTMTSSAADLAMLAAAPTAGIDMAGIEAAANALNGVARRIADNCSDLPTLPFEDLVEFQRSFCALERATVAGPNFARAALERLAVHFAGHTSGLVSSLPGALSVSLKNVYSLLIGWTGTSEPGPYQEARQKIFDWMVSSPAIKTIWSTIEPPDPGGKRDQDLSQGSAAPAMALAARLMRVVSRHHADRNSLKAFDLMRKSLLANPAVISSLANEVTPDVLVRVAVSCSIPIANRVENAETRRLLSQLIRPMVSRPHRITRLLGNPELAMRLAFSCSRHADLPECAAVMNGLLKGLVIPECADGLNNPAADYLLRSLSGLTEDATSRELGSRLSSQIAGSMLDSALPLIAENRALYITALRQFARFSDLKNCGDALARMTDGLSVANLREMTQPDLVRVFAALSDWYKADAGQTGAIQAAAPVLRSLSLQENPLAALNSIDAVSLMHSLGKWSNSEAVSASMAGETISRLAHSLLSATPDVWDTFKARELCQILAGATAFVKETDNQDVEISLLALVESARCQILAPGVLESADAISIALIFKSLRRIDLLPSSDVISRRGLKRLRHLGETRILDTQTTESLANIAISLTDSLRSNDRDAVAVMRVMLPLVKENALKLLNSLLDSNTHDAQHPSPLSRCPILSLYQLVKAYDTLQRSCGATEEIDTWLKILLKEGGSAMIVGLGSLSFNQLAQIESDNLYEVVESYVRDHAEALTTRFPPATFGFRDKFFQLRGVEPRQISAHKIARESVDAGGKHLEQEAVHQYGILDALGYCASKRVVSRALEPRLGDVTRILNIDGVPYRTDIAGGNLLKPEANTLANIFSCALNRRAAGDPPAPMRDVRKQERERLGTPRSIAIPLADTAPGTDFSAFMAMFPNQESFYYFNRALMGSAPAESRGDSVDYILEGEFNIAMLIDADTPDFVIKSAAGAIQLMPYDGFGFIKASVANKLPVCSAAHGRATAVRPGNLPAQALQHYQTDPSGAVAAEMASKLAARLEIAGAANAVEFRDGGARRTVAQSEQLFRQISTGETAGTLAIAVPSRDAKYHIPSALQHLMGRTEEMIVGRAPYNQPNLVPMAASDITNAGQGDPTSVFLSEMRSLQCSMVMADAEDGGDTPGMGFFKSRLGIVADELWPENFAESTIVISEKDVKTWSTALTLKRQLGASLAQNYAGYLHVIKVEQPGSSVAMPVDTQIRLGGDFDGDQVLYLSQYPKLREFLENQPETPLQGKTPKTYTPAVRTDGSYDFSRAAQMQTLYQGDLQSLSGLQMRFLGLGTESRQRFCERAMLGTFEGLSNNHAERLRALVKNRNHEGARVEQMELALDIQRVGAGLRFHLPQTYLKLIGQLLTNRPEDAAYCQLVQEFYDGFPWLQRSFDTQTDRYGRIEVLLNQFEPAMADELSPIAEAEPIELIEQFFTMGTRLGFDGYKSVTSVDAFRRRTPGLSALMLHAPDATSSVPYSKNGLAHAIARGKIPFEKLQTQLGGIPNLEAQFMARALTVLNEKNLLPGGTGS